MVHIQASHGRGCLALGNDLPGNFLLEIACKIPVFRILQDAVCKQQMVEVIKVGLAEKGSVEIEDGNSALYRDVVGAVLVGDGLHELHQHVFRIRIPVPVCQG